MMKARARFTSLGIITLAMTAGLQPPVHAETPVTDPLTLQSRQDAADFKALLKRTRKLEIETVGNSAASQFCGTIAPRLYHEFSNKQDLLVLRRVSLKPRNPIAGRADAWEQAGLLQMQARLDKGEKPGTIEIAEKVEEPAGTVFRYLSPIIVGQSCLQCHGTGKDVEPDTARALGIKYPHDKSMGQKLGNLIGAVSIIREIPRGDSTRERTREHRDENNHPVEPRHSDNGTGRHRGE